MKSAMHWLLATVLLVTGCAKDEPKNTSTDPTSTDPASTDPASTDPVSGSLPDGALDVTYITDDFTSAIVLHPARALNSPVVKALIDAGVPIEDQLNEFTENSGIDARNVAQLIVLLDNHTAEMAPMMFGVPNLAPPGGPGFGEPEFGDKEFGDAIPETEREPLESPEPATPEPATPEEAKPESGESDNAAITIDSDELQPVNTFVQEKAETFEQGFGEAEAEGHGDFEPMEQPIPTMIVRFIEAVDQEELFKHAPFPLTDGEVDGLKVKKGEGAAIHFVDEKTLILAPEKLLKKVVSAKDVDSPLTKHLKAADSKHDLIIVADLKPFAQELQLASGMLMGMGGNVPEVAAVAPIPSQLKAISFGMGLGSENVVELSLVLDSDENASKASESITKFLEKSRPEYEKNKGMFAGELKFENQAANDKVMEIADGVVNGAAASSDGPTLKLLIPQLKDLEGLIGLLKPEIEKAQAAAENAKKMNNLKQIGIAFHNYHDVYKAFPGAGSDGEGLQKGLSWRVHLLPMLDEYELYNEFNIDEPWDSEHNKALIARMPAVYTTPGTSEDGTTSLHVFVGEHAFALEKGIKFANITDGTSNTLLVVQAGGDKAEPWTKPGGLNADAENPLDELGSIPGDSILTLMGDGSVHAIKKDIAIETLKALITRDGGEVIDYNSF